MTAPFTIMEDDPVFQPSSLPKVSDAELIILVEGGGGGSPTPGCQNFL